MSTKYLQVKEYTDYHYSFSQQETKSLPSPHIVFNTRNILGQRVFYKTPCYTSYLYQIQVNQQKIQQVKPTPI